MHQTVKANGSRTAVSDKIVVADYSVGRGHVSPGTVTLATHSQSAQIVAELQLEARGIGRPPSHDVRVAAELGDVRMLRVIRWSKAGRLHQVEVIGERLVQS